MIGLFLGDKKLPIEILEKIKKKNVKYFIIDLSKNNKFKKNKNSYSISIGKFGKILELIHSKKCKRVLFAGNINKPKISKLDLDFKGIYYLPRIIKAAKLGDAAILKELIKILYENKIKVIKLNKFNPELTLKKGIFTKTRPSKFDIKYIKKGIDILNKTNSYNHTQALIIRENKVISFEKQNGTEKMIKSIKKIEDTNGILIKIPKKKQDLRVDLPTIGINTLKDCRKKGIKGIALKSNQNIFLDREESLKYANYNNMFILSV